MPNAAVAPSGRIAPALIALAACGAVLLAGAAVLWAYYGTTVFFEMLAAGLAYCF
jgi:hypothetical protein